MDKFLENTIGWGSVLLVLLSITILGGLVTGCKSSISTEAYKADFEKAEPLNTLPAYTGQKQVVQLATLNVNKELWEMPKQKIVCNACGTENAIEVVMDQSSFFV